jgi:hypothetical protein
METTLTKSVATAPIKFNDEEIKELSGIRGAYDQITVALGRLELQKRALKKDETRVIEQLASVENQEKVFLDKIVAKYGEGTLDATTGIFTPKNG